MPIKEYNPVRGSKPRTGGVATTASHGSYDLVKAMLHLARSRGDIVGASAGAEARGENERVQNFLKSAVPAGSTLTGNWAQPLAQEAQVLGSQFVTYQRPQTILGKLPSLTKLPFNVRIPRATSGGEGHWIRQGQAKPLTRWNHDVIELNETKVATISVFTEELLRGASIDVLNYARAELSNALSAVLDKTFIDPAIGPIADERPASVLWGTTPIVSSGDDADAVRNDVKAIINRFIAANNPPTSAVWVMPASVALSLSLMVNALGQKEFAGISMFGGTFFDIPVVTSNYAPAGIVALINQADILLADDGNYQIDVSTEASLEMDDAPTHEVITPAQKTLVSLWQTNSVGVRGERFINWTKRRDSAAFYISNVSWGGAAALS